MTHVNKIWDWLPERTLKWSLRCSLISTHFGLPPPLKCGFFSPYGTPLALDGFKDVQSSCSPVESARISTNWVNLSPFFRQFCDSKLRWIAPDFCQVSHLHQHNMEVFRRFPTSGFSSRRPGQLRRGPRAGDVRLGRSVRSETARRDPGSVWRGLERNWVVALVLVIRVFDAVMMMMMMMVMVMVMVMMMLLLLFMLMMMMMMMMMMIMIIMILIITIIIIIMITIVIIITIIVIIIILIIIISIIHFVVVVVVRMTMMMTMMVVMMMMTTTTTTRQGHVVWSRWCCCFHRKLFHELLTTHFTE